MTSEELTASPPGSKMRALIENVQEVALTRMPHAMGGGKGHKVDEVCTFALFAHGCLLGKLKEIASRRHAGGYPMWKVVRKAFAITETEAHSLCTRLGYDPDTTVRDRE